MASGFAAAASGEQRPLGRRADGVEPWTPVLTLDRSRDIAEGSPTQLADAIRRGADLRVFTTFRYNEHIEPGHANGEWVEEISDFRVTYLVGGHWSAGIMNLRMPMNPPAGFGPRPSLSFFLYNQDGTQAIARPYLDGASSTPGPTGPSPLNDHSAMSLYREFDNFDAGTNAPSGNFHYEFGTMTFLVKDDWTEMLAHEADGSATRGSLDALRAAFLAGAEIKLAIGNLEKERPDQPDYEIFAHGGPGYHMVDSRLFNMGTQPLVTVAPAAPLRYASGNWAFGSLFARTDGHVQYWRCDPYTLRFERRERRCALRWFAR